MSEKIDTAILELKTDSGAFFADLSKGEQRALSLGDIFKKVGGLFEAAGKNASDLANRIFDMGQKSQASGNSVTVAIKGIGDSFGKLAGAVAVGDLIAGGLEKLVSGVEDAALALPHLIQQSMQLGSELLNTSLKTGISVESLSKLRFVAAQTGTDLPSLTGAIFKMQAQLGAVGDESTKVKGALDRLGLNLKDLKNAKPDEAFVTILEKLHQLPSEADRAGAGVALFGKGFKEIAQLAQVDVGGLIKQAERLGIVMTTETAAAAKAAEDSLSALRFQIEGLTNRLGAAFLPAVIGIAGDLSTFFTGAVNGANTALGKMGGGDGFLALVAKAMGSGNGAIVAQTALYERLRDGLISLVQNGIEPTITGLGWLMAGFDAGIVVYDRTYNGLLHIEQALLSLNIAGLEVKKITDPFGGWQAGIDDLKGHLANVGKTIEENNRSALAAEQTEGQWVAKAASANASIEAGLLAVKRTHVDVAAIIKEWADLSTSASSQIGGALAGDADASVKVLKSFHEEAAKVGSELALAAKAGQPLSFMVQQYGKDAADVVQKSKGLAGEWEKLPALTKTVAAAWNDAQLAEVFLKMRDETHKLSESWQVELTKAANSANESIGKMIVAAVLLEAEYKDKLALATKTGLDKQLTEIKQAQAKVIAALGEAPAGEEEQWAASTDAIKAYFQDQVDQAKGTSDNIVRTMEQQGVKTRAELQRQADNARQQYLKMKADGLSVWTGAEIEAARQRWLQANSLAVGAAESQFAKLADVLGSLADDFQQLAQIGGDAFGPMLRQIGVAVKAGEELSKVFDLMSKTSTASGGKGFDFASIAQIGAGWVAVATAIISVVEAIAQAAAAEKTAEFNLAYATQLGKDFGSATAFSDALSQSIENTEGHLRSMAVAASDLAKMDYSKFAASQIDALNTVVDSTTALGRELAEALNLTEVLKELGGVSALTADGIKRVGQDITDLFEITKLGGTLGTQAVKQLDDSLVQFGNAATQSGGLVNQMFIDAVKHAKDLGVQLTQVNDFIVGQLQSAATGLNSLLGGLQASATAKAQQAARDAGQTNEDVISKITGVVTVTQQQATGLAAAITGTFAEMVDRGVSFTDALAAIQPAFNTLQKSINGTGINGGQAFDRLRDMSDIAADAITGPLLSGIQGANQALKGLNNAGILNQDEFSALARTAGDSFMQIVAQGKNGDAALQAISPTLQTIWELQQNFGYSVDDATQALLDQAVAAGEVGEKQKPVQEQMLDATNRIADAVEGLAKLFGVTLPDKAKDGAAGIQAALDGIKAPTIDVRYTSSPQGSGGPDNGGAQAMGGMYRVRRPTLFLAGEKPGGEDIAFSGIGRRFSQPGFASEDAATAALLREVVTRLDVLGDIRDGIYSDRNTSVQVDGRELVRAHVRTLENNVDGSLTRVRNVLGV